MTRRGFTLVELMVGVLIGVTITTAAVAFVRHETRLMGITNDRLGMVQSSRAAMDLLASDLRQAGLGTVSTDTGDFAGLYTGDFALNGANFTSNAAVDLKPSQSVAGGYTVNSMDLGMRVAAGDQATIVDFTGVGTTAGQIQVCNRPGLAFADDELVLLQGEYNRASLGVRLVQEVTAAGACPCQTTMGTPCRRFEWSLPGNDAQGWENDPSARNMNYVNGQVFGNHRTVVYFVDQQDVATGKAELYRMDFSELPGTCAAPARDPSCAGLVADNVEAIYYQVWTLAPGGGGWAQLTPGDPIPIAARIRVDVELVVRGDKEKESEQPAVLADLGGGVRFPDAGRDRVERQVFRTSVQVRNAGIALNRSGT